MRVKKISFLNEESLSEIENIEDDNLDVFIELESGYTCIVTVATPKNIVSLMDKEKKDFFGPAAPIIFVRRLTTEIIEAAIKAYAAEYDGYWLKSYHFAGEIDVAIYDKLEQDHIQYLKELDELENS